ncbi:glycoside hydrolase family 73 protein [Massilia sp. DD77]|uniref:glycoside hydrolase family 73 protein n=1 Tax=Massilia sp. DD77 TaxID=3109349 RepID=UPI003000B8DC
MTPNQFIDELLLAAQECHRASGIPASFTIAQAALETGWGKRVLGKNLFGIKADKSWKGETVMVDTHEVIKGVRTPMKCAFRAYGSWSDCMQDRAKFFASNPRYRYCFQETTGEGWARAVAAAGYATDPNYAKTLAAIIKGRNLIRFDLLPKG